MKLFRRAEQRNATLGLADPALAAWFNAGAANYTGVSVGEYSALGVPAVWRAVNLISGAVASLPLKSYRTLPDGTRERVKSFLDDPGGFEGATPFEWVETVMAHLLLHGNAYLVHAYGGAGQLMGLVPVHPCAVSVECDATVPGGKVFRIQLVDGTARVLTGVDLTHIPALMTDPNGVGLSPIAVARNAFGTTIASQQAAARQFGNGAMIAGLVTPEDDLDATEAQSIKEGLDRKMGGVENANSWVVVNRRLKFSPWQMSNADAQFLESRAYQTEEVARIYGLPPILLGDSSKTSSWGTGVSEILRATHKFTLQPWLARIEQRLSRLLSQPRFVEFDTSGFLRPTPEVEIQMLIAEVNNGLLSPNEARAIRNMPPIAGGDTLRTPPGAAPQNQPAPGAEQEQPV